MKIIIAGGGKVGQAIAKHLTGEEHDIDMEPDSPEPILYQDLLKFLGNVIRL